MFEKHVEGLKEKLVEIESRFSDGSLGNDPKKMVQLNKDHSLLKKKLDLFDQVENLKSQLIEARAMLVDESGDSDLVILAQEDISEKEPLLKSLEKQLFWLLFPQNPMDERNVIVEIRAGTGGEEACLFCEQIFKMYFNFSEKKNWKFQLLHSHGTGLGGYKEVIASIEGEDVYRRLCYESGTHRVQRVPQTESSGRIHTSAITVAVLPEAEDVDIDIQSKDIRVDVYRSSGPGGQSVNTMDSAVRITHFPSGLVVQCQDGKSQRQNRLQAMKVLKTRLLKQKKEEEMQKRADERKSQVGSGDRSQKIRTYNFPQGRVTDHRIPLTVYQLDSVLSGEIDVFIDALMDKDYENLIKTIGEV